MSLWQIVSMGRQAIFDRFSLPCNKYSAVVKHRHA